MNAPIVARASAPLGALAAQAVGVGHRVAASASLGALTAHAVGSVCGSGTVCGSAVPEPQTRTVNEPRLSR